MDWFELGLLGIFAALSLWVLALDLWQVVVHGRTWTGTDGFFVVDQMQYLAWIQDASRHLLASNLFVLHATPTDYFQPAVAISGGLVWLGVAPWLALMLWKPVAVVAMFYGARAYAHRSLSGRWERRSVLALALFFASFSVVYGSFSVVGDLIPAFLSWGYVFGLMAVAALVLALVEYDRGRQRNGLSYRPALLGALASALHPWQGELLIVIVLATELAFNGDRVSVKHRLRLAAVTVAATGLPLLYYLILGRFDLSWSLARDASKHDFSFWTVALAIGPLLVPALLGYRIRPRTFLGAVTRIWPVAAMFVYVLSASGVSATPLHAFDGISIPLAVLAVQGVQRAGWRRVPHRQALGALAIGAVTIPATVYLLAVAPEFMGAGQGNSNFIAPGESRALSYLRAEPMKGGVLTRFYLGSLVPGITGRRTFVGNCLWSEPGCTPRAIQSQQLFDGSMSSSAARSFVRETGARFVLADCQTTSDMNRLLGPTVISTRRFGCATVYELDAPGPPTWPLAQSPPHAAVRAPRGE